MPITSILTTNTFRDWFNKTNEIINKLNTGVVTDGAVANGTYSVNGSFSVVSTFVANTSVVLHTGNTTFAANAVATANCNSWNFACGTLLIQPINGTTVNSAITINALSTFLQTITASANVAITGDVTQVGNAFFSGTFTSNSGPMIVRQVLFASANAIATPAALTNPQYDDFAPAGGDIAAVWALTPNIDTVVTGIAAPAFSAGARVLYIQNQSTTFKITLASANTSSQVNNRFKTQGDSTFEIPPNGSAELVYNTANHQWRPTASYQTTFTAAAISGNVSIGGTLAVTGNTTLSANASITGQLAVSNTAALGNTTITGWANVTSTLQVGGAATLGANVAVGGNLAVTGIANTGNTTITGFANVSTTLQVGGNATVGGNTTVSGIAFLNGNVAITMLANAAYPQVAKTTAYTVTLNDYTVFANGTFNVTLPAAATATGRVFHVKNINTGVITVKGNASELIDATNTFPLTTQNQSVTVQSDGTRFWVI
jgi:carbonic anhydrase/acetyltransferase-like protein (isoleucine patch superfamily)